MKALHMAAFILMVVGAVNWGLVALFNLNLVMVLFGAWPMVEKLVYVLVAASAVYVFATHKQDCKVCSSKK